MRISATVLAKIALPAFLLAGCGGSEPTTPISPGDDDHTPPDTAVASSSCVSCHTDYDLLQTVHTPDSVLPAEGCSGPPPYIQPYDRVYLKPAGFARFEASSHGDMTCTACHGGIEGTAEKSVAHSGAFRAMPSFEKLDVCTACHADIVGNFQKGLHFNGWGQKNSQIQRAGVASFDQLHEGIQVGYEQNCSTCHASCGSCHVNRPLAAGGGLMDGHDFSPPDMRDNCTACHASRGGHAFYGTGPGTQPDVHLTKAGFTCLSCHTKSEMHNADGAQVDHRYQVQALPECAECHSDVDRANEYHNEHWGDLNCQTCHSQDYNTCGSCHVGGEGARIHSHLEFKIGVNPLPERPYTFSTLRRTLAAPDSWESYGVNQLADFSAKPLYNYTTPHNILLWTSRTTVGAGETCSASCHIGPNGENQELYLFSTDFTEEWERLAAQRVVVDGRLPASWGGR